MSTMWFEPWNLVFMVFTHNNAANSILHLYLFYFSGVNMLVFKLILRMEQLNTLTNNDITVQEGSITRVSWRKFILRMCIVTSILLVLIVNIATNFIMEISVKDDFMNQLEYFFNETVVNDGIKVNNITLEWKKCLCTCDWWQNIAVSVGIERLILWIKNYVIVSKN